MRGMYRFFEILPGAAVWLSLIVLVLLSWKQPFLVSIFFIVYSFFWLVRIFYLHLHLRFSFMKMREYLKIDWLEKVKTLSDHEKSQALDWSDLRHLIVLPMYHEPFEVVNETFLKIKAANYPKEKMIVVLSVEEKGGEAALAVAHRAEEQFGDLFFKFLITRHPAGLAGEIPGKGSNETWAVKAVKEKIIDPLDVPYENVVVSVFDIDTQPFPEYFGRLAYLFLTVRRPQRSSYQPMPLFLNNIYEAPIFSRISSFFPTFWQMMQQSRSEQLTTFTSQAMPLKALIEVDYWDKDRVSEDALIFWRFYLHYEGDWRAVPMHYPVSMDANAAPTLWQTAKNLYKQQRRWAWGVENLPYMLTGFIKHKKIPFREKFFWTLIFAEGFYSWATAPFILFTMGWLPVFLGSAAFNTTLLSYNLPKTIGFLMNFSVFGLAASAILSAMLLPPKPDWFKRRHYLIYFLQWILTPIVIIFWSGVPAVDAQTRMMIGGKYRLGFWLTPKSRR
ncbi:MAG: hypothetical protein UY23_C0001G0255 [Candidatus Jorgensenbacteria bacterium GW2011_GWA1_48_11]|uniref:Glycosyltransferase 2-like domain-containing protein n=1 Tax=Candidatus Jorgensenbacteria bacterium GW2011_GWA1_48_11 TaxID=1618660 RepID=A0A0G1UC16_9BACT|nr:MAG: hypothetical protein UY23_C0001G0255 [Candidatus Jorgensenbacteria bacterium GW2011_GWA1_48_11]KKW12141.1 MAG: hypothetical protein UY51_C0005G0383 [Candidatus Jorgensenbacteria bacterium GW2011_GWB1_49_9]